MKKDNYCKIAFPAGPIIEYDGKSVSSKKRLTECQKWTKMEKKHTKNNFEQFLIRVPLI